MHTFGVLKVEATVTSILKILRFETVSTICNPFYTSNYSIVGSNQTLEINLTALVKHVFFISLNIYELNTVQKSNFLLEIDFLTSLTVSKRFSVDAGAIVNKKSKEKQRKSWWYPSKK